MSLSRSPRASARRARLLAAVAALAAAFAAILASSAGADVRISRAELDGSRLRLEGTAIPNRTITVDGVAMGTSDAGGSFKIERDPFTPPSDCIVDVNDGSAAATPARLSGCTATTATTGGAGTVAILPGGNGSGRVTSQPAGIDCTILNGNGDPATTCSAAFPAGTFVRLDARPAPDTQFLGWRGVGCQKGEVTVAAGVTTVCQVGFQRKL
ncbi:MAG TPA: hypothetical protein VFB26_11280 [Gaiellaceae bacterium]|nr:hypothetical protein [Gaiellaceae bacterium]